jgi:hypothetical protein
MGVAAVMCGSSLIIVLLLSCTHKRARQGSTPCCFVCAQAALLLCSCELEPLDYPLLIVDVSCASHAGVSVLH